MELNGRRKNKMKIHPLTVCREKLQNNDFITTNYRKKAEMLEDIIAEEEELRNFAAEIYFEISNKILVRNSKRRKVLDCLKKLNPDNFDSVEWVLFDSYTESTNE